MANTGAESPEFIVLFAVKAAKARTLPAPTVHESRMAKLVTVVGPELGAEPIVMATLFFTVPVVPVLAPEVSPPVPDQLLADGFSCPRAYPV